MPKPVDNAFINAQFKTFVDFARGKDAGTKVRGLPAAPWRGGPPPCCFRHGESWSLGDKGGKRLSMGTCRPFPWSTGKGREGPSSTPPW
jgi:hypothetical protein